MNDQDPEESSIAKSHLGFPVVGVGASAGGLAALRRLLEGMPADSGMAFVVVMHLAPDHESMLGEILQRASKYPVTTVIESIAIEANHVYVISPSMKLQMTDGHLRVAPLTTLEGRRQSIDFFFRSLAHAHRERGVCIVLSGTGSDGSQGLKRIKELGGVAIAQVPEDAEFDGMPTSAIQTGLIDFALTVHEMPQKLIDLWANARRIALPRPPPLLEVEEAVGEAGMLGEEALISIKALLRERTGHDFAHYKRGTVLRRLERRMQVNAVPDLASYRRLLDTEPKETPALLQDMLISVTNFFRDPDAFAALGAELASAIEERPSRQTFRAWIAGCATGEEAYSVAMVLHELLEERATIQIFASDIDQRAVAAARTGIYPASIATDVSPERLRRFFVADPAGYRIAQNLRDSVVFSVHNALSDPPFTRMDLISCRNLLIYLDRSGQAQILRNFHFALNAGALLFLGSSEGTDAVGGYFIGIDKAKRLYRASPDVARSRTLPAVATRSRAPTVPPVYAAAAQAERAPLESLHERVFRNHGPPTVLLDADETVLHVSERAAHLLRVAAGTPSNKIMDLARPELRAELRAALARAAETGSSVEARRIRLSVDGGARIVTMTVRPVLDETPAGLVLVVFEDVAETMMSDAVGERDPVIDVLEGELRRAQERLRLMAGESAASTEELRASNEELQTINEEMRSTTEELETSQEELQSTNEELTTVNGELSVRVEDASRTNDDLQNLMTSAEIGTVFVDRELRIKRFTPQAAALMRLRPSDEGRVLTDIRHRLEYPELEADAFRSIRTLEKVEREVRGDDGRWFLARVVPYRIGLDRIDGAALAFVDVTTRRVADQALHDSEQQMRMLVESMRDYAILTLDVQGRVVTWSPGAVRIFGYEASELEGQAYDLLFTAEDRQRGEPARELRDAREVGRADDDRWMVRKDHQRIYCSGITTPMTDGGALIGYAKIARDFTSEELQFLKREGALLEEKSARVKLQQANAMKDEFLAVMSHELKNPLAIIQMNAQLLPRIPGLQGDPRAEKASRAILAAVASQTQIIDDLLELSRVNTGKVTLEPVRLDLSALVSAIADALAPDVNAKHQELTLDLPEALWTLADPVRVEQIVWNLLTNAVKFTPERRPIHVTLSVDGPMAKLSVVDSGVGIESAQLSNVFLMFRQLDTGASRRKAGLGIGLALVKQLTELHQGRVEARSQGLGQGSEFVVWLPIAGAPATAASPEAETVPTLKGLRLLLVDDEPNLLEAFVELMRDEGAEVTAVHSASEALASARSTEFDAVVSDIAMPEHDGYWLARQMRRDAGLARIPMVAVSGMARGADKQAALDAGFDMHVGKPLQMATLRTGLLDAIVRRKAG